MKKLKLFYLNNKPVIHKIMSIEAIFINGVWHKPSRLYNLWRQKYYYQTLVEKTTEKLQTSMKQTPTDESYISSLRSLISQAETRFKQLEKDYRYVFWNSATEEEHKTFTWETKNL